LVDERELTVAGSIDWSAAGSESTLRLGAANAGAAKNGRAKMTAKTNCRTGSLRSIDATVDECEAPEYGAEDAPDN
jgi:hypothetical protein